MKRNSGKLSTTWKFTIVDPQQGKMLGEEDNEVEIQNEDLMQCLECLVQHKEMMPEVLEETIESCGQLASERILYVPLSSPQMHSTPPNNTLMAGGSHGVA